ncbi:hypothetical protein [Streptacidiphilus sp. EB103A]|uniref:hypothetical protein n=1 Tax=Streptacidiphilus sp. EB103A TaxID=3156275 RepID=UPI003511056A
MYIDNEQAYAALAVAAEHADKAGVPVPFLWDGSEWTTRTGERRDIPLIRRDMGGWLAGLAGALERLPSASARAAELRAQATRENLRIVLGEVEGDKAEYVRTDVEMLRVEADLVERGELGKVPDLWREIDPIKSVATEVLTASNARAIQLLSLASQFDAFRAPMRDPADWVRDLGTAPRTEHVRTALVWDAFVVAEPGLSGSLGERAGKRALFAAMDKRFGARKKLAGYEGWRGVALPA